MKRVLSTFALVICVTLVGFGQYDQKAFAILEAMSAKYKSYPAFKAKIIYSLQNEIDGVNENFKGEISIKGEKYRLITDEQEVINNGETVWTYLPDIKEVNIDNYDPDNGDIAPSEIYTAYEKGYKYLFLEEKTVEGNVYEVVDLVPEDVKNTQFFKVRMEIKKNDKTLKRWTMFDKSGNKYIYQVVEFYPSLNLDDSFFVFDISKYEGVEVIDLR